MKCEINETSEISETSCETSEISQTSWTSEINEKWKMKSEIT